MSDERQNFEGSSDETGRPVQAARFTEARRKSDTENARTVAHHHGWRFNADDELTEDFGPVIAWTIEDAAAAMVALGWIVRHRVDWTPIPYDGAEAAADLRSRLDDDGRFPGR